MRSQGQDISVRRGGSGTGGYGGPYGIGYDPFEQMEQMLSALMGSTIAGSRSLGRLGRRGSGSQEVSSVPVDVIDNNEAYQILAELPGCNPNDIEVTVAGDNLLTIRAQSSQQRTQQQQANQQQGVNWLIAERQQGTYLRTLHLPEHVDRDQIRANYTNGVLEVIVPKSREHQQQQKRIQITSNPSGSQGGSGSGG